MVLPSGLFPSGFLTINLYLPIFSPIRATCPTHLILFDLITRITNKIIGFTKQKHVANTVDKKEFLLRNLYWRNNKYFKSPKQQFLCDFLLLLPQN